MNNKICICTYLIMSLKKITEYKMKNIFALFTFIISLLFSVYLHGQPDYVVSATNGVLVDNQNYEFDIYVLSTGTVPLELATFQVSIFFNDAISDSGTLTAAYIDGTSTLTESNQYPNPPNITFTSEGGVIRQLRIAPKTPPGAGNGSVISDAAPGTRFGRFRITNSVPFDTVTPVNWQWNFTAGLDKYSSYLNAYLSSINTNISDPSKFFMDLDDPLSPTNTFQLSVDVINGWNMLAVPGINSDGQGVSFWWSGLTGSVYKFVPGSGYSPVTTTTPGEGYWVKNTGDNVYNTGDEWPADGIQIVPHDPINAFAGWNMFGGYEDIVDATALTTIPPGQIIFPVYKFLPGTGYQTASSIAPGYGYWIKLTGNGQIIIPGQASKGLAKAIKYFNDDWGKIIITDNEGNSYTLYAVKEKSNDKTTIDLNQYELPPPPPGGVFDIRYGTGRIAEELNKDFKSIEMNGVKYPLKVKAENTDIRVMDVTGKEINVNIKSGEEITIDNENIKKLMISGELIPDKYALEQNYPNPFNPTTTIEFSLPENVKNVKVSIYNVLGEKVTELVNASLIAGKYQYQWNAINVASGVYIYELRTEKFSSIKKMILLK